MTGIGGRLQDFGAEARLLQASLGLLGVGARIEALLGAPRADGKRSRDVPLVYFFLGVVSATRTLRATLAGGEERRPRVPPVVAPTTAEKRTLEHVLSLR